MSYLFGFWNFILNKFTSFQWNLFTVYLKQAYGKVQPVQWDNEQNCFQTDYSVDFSFQRQSDDHRSLQLDRLMTGIWWRFRSKFHPNRQIRTGLLIKNFLANFSDTLVCLFFQLLHFECKVHLNVFLLVNWLQKEKERQRERQRDREKERERETTRRKM